MIGGEQRSGIYVNMKNPSEADFNIMNDLREKIRNPEHQLKGTGEVKRF